MAQSGINPAKAEIDRSAQKFGPVWLTRGVGRGNAGALLWAAFVSIFIMTFVGNFQPYIFEENLGIPKAEQGTLSANLAITQELIILIVIGLYGAMSDRVGRRPIYAAGFLLVAIGYVLYPLATSREELFIYRAVFALGAAAVTAMLAAVLSDYPQEPSRGKLVAMCFMLNGLGLVVLLGAVRNLPVVFNENGYDAITAGRMTFWIVAGVALLSSLVVARGLKKGAPAQLKKSEPMLKTLKVGLKEGRRPRIALAYLSALVSRGDLSVVSTFFTLWLIQVGTARGLETDEAFAKATVFFIVIQVAALLWAAMLGPVIDRFDRVKAMAAAMAIAAIGYLFMGLQEDPLGPQMYFAAVLLGMGEVNAILASQSLIGQEAPERGRGAVIGVYSFFGAVGILCAAKLGGYLFDEWRQSGPYLMMGIANCVLFTVALGVLFYERVAGRSVRDEEVPAETSG